MLGLVHGLGGAGSMRFPLFSQDQTPTEVRAAISAAGPTRFETLHPSDQGPLGIGKLRMVGVYDDRFEGTFMLRLRIPGGRLNASQLEAVADVAQDFAVRSPGVSVPDRFVEVTTRQDIQIHWIRFEHLPQIWARFDAVGLGSLEACGNTMRNVTACPVDGVDSDCLIEVSPIVDAIGALIDTDERLTAFLPRKFKVAVTGCPSDCVVTRVNCLAFTPARREGRVGFGVHVGGGLSDYPRLATALDMFVEPQAVPDVVRATLQVYSEFGDYEHSSVNRFRAVVHELGPERIADELRSRLPGSGVESGGQDLSTWKVQDHLGVHADRAGTNYVGLSVPVGRLDATELVELARLARLHGDSGVRLTQRQNLVLTGVRDVDALLAEPLLTRLRPDPDPFERAVVACTSAPYCKFAILPMKAYGTELIEQLRTRVPQAGWHRLAGLRIHMSGCKASCAQVPLAHIGLRATMGKNETESFDAFDVALGGDSGAGKLAAWARLEVPSDGVFDAITSYLVGVAQGEASLDSIDLQAFDRPTSQVATSDRSEP